MKRGTVLLLVMTATVLMMSGVLSPRQAAASVDFINQWPARPVIVSDGAAGSVAGKFTVSAANNRLMLVAVATEYGAAQTPGFTVTYGGQTVTQIVNNTTGNNKIWLGYLNETGIAAATSTSLAVTNSVTTNLTAMYVTAAVFKDVNQTTPITGSGSLGTTTAALTIGSVGYTMTGNAGLAGNNGLSVYVVNWNNSVGQTTASTGYTGLRNYAGTNFSLSGSYKATVGASVESISSTTTTTSAIAALAGVGLNPMLKVATVTICADCHGNPPEDGSSRNVPPGYFVGSHEKHAGKGNNQYGFLCTQCHYNASTTNHSTGYKNITGSSLPGNAYTSGKKIATTNSPTLGTCSNVTCHSSGRTVKQYATTPAWGSPATCLSCHGGRNSSTGVYSRSASNFSMSTTHGQHLKYATTEINCQMCHGKTAANHTALKDYSGAIYHGNGTANVFFTNIAYGSYTSYKSGTKKCANTACHGGTSRGAWSDNGAVNNNHTCSHCHGTANTPTSNTDRRAYAPGFRKVGTSTDQSTSSNDLRVGAHFKHLSSAYMKNIKCNECHKVPSTPFSADTNHTLNNLRYNSGTLDFSQASSARILIGVSAGSTPAQLASFAGYTNGTAVKASTCSSVYCHGNRLKNGPAGGTYTKPYWNYSAMINYTNPATACSRCHGNPPTSVTASHNGVTPTTGCSGCHGTVVNATGVIINKALHINGQVDGGGHAYPYPGSVHDSLAVPISNCTGCHTNVSGTYPVTRPTKPDCRSCHINASPGTGCSSCHGRSTTGGVALNYSAARPNGGIGGPFPNYSGSHTAHVIKQGFACTGCHSGYGTGSDKHGFSNTSGATYSRTNFKKMAFTIGGTPTWSMATMTCSTLSCHGTAVWGGRLKCIDCHSAAVSSPNAQALDATVTTRDAVVGEFTNTWSHKRSFTGTPKVVDEDCVVCHMEGTKTTNAKSAVHGNGYVNLRDPDTGLNIKNVTFGGANAGAYTEGATDVTFVRFKRDYSKRLELDPNWLTIAAIQQNHCLKCHDTNGASNTNANVPTTGTALKPFGVTITGHVAPYDSNGNGNVVDVNKSFLTTNSSYHPVRGRQNNWYAKYSSATAGTSNMIAPYTGPFATRGGTVSATAYGILISCWDCHAPNPTTYASGVVARTVTAHGAAATLRGTIRAGGTTGATNLCVNCHRVSYATTAANHGANSAFTSGKSNMGTTTFNNCAYCHAYGPVGGTASQATWTNRPLRGEDAHGFNDRTAGTVGSKWATSATRPYGFIRNTLSNYAPASTTASGETIAGSARTCQGTGGTCGTDMGGSAGIVGTGGTY